MITRIEQYKEHILKENLSSNYPQYMLDGVITLWGNTMYLNYMDLPSGPDYTHDSRLINAFNEFMKEDYDTEKYLDFIEWFDEGAKIKGSPLLTKKTFDILMHANETVLTEELDVYRSGKIHSTGWMSFTVADSAHFYGYKDGNTDSHLFILKPGAKVIFTRGLADENEIIINANQLQNAITETYYPYDEVYPSEEFGKHTGLDWVYKDWKMPFGMLRDEIGKKLRKWFSDVLNNNGTETEIKTYRDNIIDIYNKIIRVNKELKKIPVKSIGDVYDVCMGVISKFNFDDINFFVSFDNVSRIKHNIENRPIISQLEIAAGHDMQWVPSPFTTEKLLNHFNIKN